MAGRDESAKPLGRRAVMLGAAAAGLSAAGSRLLVEAAFAYPFEAAKMVEAFAKNPPKDGKVTIRVPEIAENGNTVPITILVDSPMTEADHVKTILLVAENNPAPGVIRADLTPLMAQASLQFRMRLSQTQTIIAVAALSDGSFWRAEKLVKVTIGGCGG